MTMGGFGSGRHSYRLRTTVDECRQIDINDLSREGLLRPDFRGSSTWTRCSDGEAVASVGFLVDGEPGGTATGFVLSYSVPSTPFGERREVTYRVGIEYTECNFGGERPWFQCPGPRGRTCGERVGKLYKPPRRDRFLCRHCYDLAYESRQRSGKFFFENIRKPLERHQEAVDRLKDGPPTREEFRDVYEAQKASQHGLRHLSDRLHALQSSLPSVPEDYPVGPTISELPPFEQWFDDLIHQSYGSPGGRTYGIHGRCEATAKTTGERCWQPATGRHGKCYYHGGAPDAGAPEGNQNAAIDAD